ncbi:helix-turn-helix transcriptional regulator [Streptosporangium pseudovulgare]|uniref:Helix-turn-helix transcriptional regulator n=1 Tax=Streptosporangium pseudovulgare TaxID=35765 RepID=A0ABQ2RM30_9ACTN|nr:helix-turn-helix transcriptional regulator [Streptosporangium pseudovulgare]GGQ35033.1 helix-turn-helix transcriptional regulator [Streptosporangium pseudovulgare]
MVAERVVSPVFIGRGEELSALATALDTAIGQGPAVALVAGEAGIGKSRLLAEFARSLGPGVRVVEGACAELGGDGLPYAPFVTVLRRLIRVEGVLPGPYHQLARWFPELGEAGDAEGGKHRLYEEVLTLVERVAADQPLVVSIEDLHWADAATRELLGFLARNLTQAGVLLVITYRPPETGDGLPGPLLSELTRRPRTTTLRLERLDRQDVGRQLAAILGAEQDAAAVRRVHERSDGNPLFVEALARAGERTPDSLRDLLLHGPRSLPGPARELLGIASAAGGRVGHRLLAQVAGQDGAGLDALLRELVDRGLLVTAGDGYDFRHALIRQAVYEDLLPGELSRLHARYAEALRDSGAHAELAAHAYAAGDRGLALSAAYLAADQARRSYAYEEQVRLLDQVLELWDPQARLGADRIDVLTGAAKACMLSGEYARGVEYAGAGLAEVDERREPERAALLLEHRGRLRHRLEGTGVSDWERALELLPAALDGVQRGRLLGVLSMGLLPDVKRARKTFEEALAIGRRTGDAMVTIRGLLGIGSMTRDLGMLAQARTLAERLDGHDLLMTVPMYEATLHTKAGDQHRAIEAARDGIRHARRYGLGRSRGAELARFAGHSLILAGRWDEAAAVLQESLRQDPPPLPRQALRALAGYLALLRGDLAGAADAAAEVEHTDNGGMFPRYRLLCLLAVAQDDHERADLLLDRALADPALTRIYSSDARPVLVAGALAQRARLAHGDGKDLRERVEKRQAELSAADAALGVDGPLDRAWQTMLRALIEDDGWDHAAGAWRELRQPYELALSLVHGARAALAAGDRPGATSRLREAARLAEDLGAAPLAREIALLGRPRPAQGGLTERERDVLRLIAEGLSNRQIAARLHISPSTAGVHVSHILSKLGATTRTEAAVMAHRQRLVDEPQGASRDLR